MSGDKLDPNVKMHMSLDQIIQLDKSLNRAFKKKWRKKKNQSVEDHSVPLRSSLGGGFIYVSKTSPLLYERKRRLMEAKQNRKLNSGLVRMTKKVIPACYHLVKTDTGFEKVLLPIRLNNVRRKKTKKKRGAGKGICEVKRELNFNDEISITDESFGMNSDSIFQKKFSHSSTNDSDDEVVVLYSSIKSKEDTKQEAMDVDSVSVNSNSIWINPQCNNFPRPFDKTLNDRFRSTSRNTTSSASSIFEF